MSVVEDGTVYQVGTFNGNPLTMAAAKASLLEVLTPDAYQHLDRINERLLAGCQDVIDRYGLPGYSVGIGSKGCVTFADEKITDFATFKKHQDAELADLAWLYNLNRGIFGDARARRGMDVVDRAHRGSRGRLRRLLRRDGARPDGPECPDHRHRLSGRVAHRAGGAPWRRLACSSGRRARARKGQCGAGRSPGGSDWGYPGLASASLADRRPAARSSRSKDSTRPRSSAGSDRGKHPLGHSVFLPLRDFLVFLG